MCGIIGAISVKPFDGSWIKKGLKKMEHRGPDAEGYWHSEDNTCYLGHRRLSIIDLSNLGNQPMHLKEESLSIVFNGEIYNYKELKEQLKEKGHSFKSKSDTEVLLHAYVEYGIDFVSKLNGMFSFCLVDKKENLVFLVRDRAGEKPLFYSYDNGNISFASELKGLIENPSFDRNVDRESLDCLLGYGYIPGDLCIYKKAKKLPPAHILSFNIKNNKLNVYPYWKLPDLNTSLTNTKSDDIIKNELNELLKDSVNKQLIADVPVGVLLSGGVDSSLITAYASMCSNNVKTFTVTFPENKKFDESAHARLIANHFGTNHTEIEGSILTPYLLESLAMQYDEPMIDSSMLPTYMVSNLVKNHCTVALGGDGGDELFGGYGHYSRLLWMAEKLGPIPKNIRQGISMFAKNLPIGFKGRIWLQNLGENFDSDLPLIATLFEDKFRESLMTKNFNWDIVAEQKRKARVPNASSLLQRATRMDFYNYLPEDILVKVDRASMLNSLELRSPFLDHRIIDYAFSSVPDNLKCTSSQRKIILKNIAKDILPSEFDFERKQGFGVPLGKWIRGGEWKTFFGDILLYGNDSLFNKKTVEKIYKSHMNGNDNTERLFSLVMLELWRKKYKVNF